MDPLTLATIAGIGSIAGLFAGLLGIGGGIIMTPLLLIVFEKAGMPPAEAAIGALATSLAAIFFTAVPSVCVHAYYGSVQWKVLAWLSPAAVLGAVVAARIALAVPPVLLIIVLVLLLIASAARILRSKKAAGLPEAALPSRSAAAGIGLVAGFLGALTGTGGGIVVTPLLSRLGVPLIAAIGTSAGNIALISLGATLSFGGAGLNLPALAVLAPCSLVMSAVGARLANALPNDKLRIVYVACLCLIIARLSYWILIQLTA